MKTPISNEHNTNHEDPLLDYKEDYDFIKITDVEIYKYKKSISEQDDNLFDMLKDWKQRIPDTTMKHQMQYSKLFMKVNTFITHNFMTYMKRGEFKLITIEDIEEMSIDLSSKYLNKDLYGERNTVNAFTKWINTSVYHKLIDKNRWYNADKRELEVRRTLVGRLNDKLDDDSRWSIEQPQVDDMTLLLDDVLDMYVPDPTRYSDKDREMIYNVILSSDITREEVAIEYGYSMKDMNLAMRKYNDDTKGHRIMMKKYFKEHKKSRKK